jgi:putative tricarboxylic transport membrane protein
MNEEAGRAAGRGISIGVAESVTALLLAGIGALAILDSLRLGMGWGEDGPQAGYFPFWLGVGLVLFSAANGFLAFRSGIGRRVFLSWEQGRHVLSVLLPTLVFVGLIAPLGIYLPAVLLITWFMIVLGRFAWPASVALGVAVAGLAFATFELWFLVPLPKGPLEAALGF